MVSSKNAIGKNGTGNNGTYGKIDICGTFSILEFGVELGV